MYFSLTRHSQIVVRDKLSGVGRHMGVLLPNGLVAHLTSERGIEVVSYESFAQGRTVQIVRQAARGSERAIQDRLHRALRAQPPYALMNFNCETFATWLVGEKPESQQVNGLVLFAGLIAIASLAR